MSVAQYGAFAYASEENYCHTARWVISGTLLPEYSAEPHPVAIKRGTRAEFIERLRTDCSSHGGNDVQDQDLVHVRLLDGKFAGTDRYVLPTDYYSQSQYRAQSNGVSRSGTMPISRETPRTLSFTKLYDGQRAWLGYDEREPGPYGLIICDNAQQTDNCSRIPPGVNATILAWTSYANNDAPGMIRVKVASGRLGWVHEGDVHPIVPLGTRLVVMEDPIRKSDPRYGTLFRAASTRASKTEIQNGTNVIVEDVERTVSKPNMRVKVLDGSLAGRVGYMWAYEVVARTGSGTLSLEHADRWERVDGFTVR